MNKRKSAVEGRFYPSSREKIFQQIREIESARRYPPADVDPERILGAVLPHAGHIYSGHQTVPFFQLLQHQKVEPDLFVIVHPNHSGQGVPLAIDDSDMWTNSIGDVPVDREFGRIMDLPFDRIAHAREHSAEVIIPFLQYFQPDHPFSIVPVCMGDQRHTFASLVAEKISHAALTTGKNIMVLASCDFSHFLPPEDGFNKDQHVIDEILSRNPEEVEKVVSKHQVSICGYGPVMALMNYAGSVDKEYRIRILARGHSGEVIPSQEVVDYISMIMYL